MLYLDNKATPDNKATQVLVGFLRKTHLLIMEFERIPYSCILSNSMIMSVPFSKTPAELLIKNPKCGYQLQIGTDWNFENDLLAGFWENHLPLTSKSSNSLQGEHRPAARKHSSDGHGKPFRNAPEWWRNPGLYSVVWFPHRRIQFLCLYVKIWATFHENHVQRPRDFGYRL